MLDSFKSTWGFNSINAFEILNKYPDGFSIFNDAKFVNEVIFKTALEYSFNPKAIMAEGCGLLFKLLFYKCINKVNFID